MASRLYLDTARVGKMSPTAAAIQADYLRFASKSGSIRAFEDLLLHEGRGWPSPLRRRYPFLSTWEGVGPLKEGVRRLVAASADQEVLFASRSQSLMRLAAHLLVRKSERVLVTDLGWPAYQAILRQVAAQAARKVVEVPLRKHTLAWASARELASVIAEAYHAQHCHALFLPAITHDGIRLPVRQILASIRQRDELRFVAVDGAQDIAHGPTSLARAGCDFYLAGAHKWLRAYHPLGIAVYGRKATAGYIETTRRVLTERGILDDPLLQFSEQLAVKRLDGGTETVNLFPLLSAQGAVRDRLQAGFGKATMAIQQASARQLRWLASEWGWVSPALHPSLQSGIVLLESAHAARGGRVLRHHFERHGVTVTAYDGGQIRVSLPRLPMGDHHWKTLQRAFVACRERSQAPR